MNNLFNISSNGKVEFNVDALAIPPFSTLWDRDPTVTKDKATMEIKYVYFLCDANSPYRKSYSERDVEPMIRKDFIRDPNWNPDEVVLDAVKKYEEFQATTFSRLINNSLKLADKMSDYMTTISFEDKDEKQAKDIIDTIVKTLEKVGNIVKSLTSLKKQVETDSVEQNKARGKTDINDYELPE
jgi:hypothetical protein